MHKLRSNPIHKMWTTGIVSCLLTLFHGSVTAERIGYVHAGGDWVSGYLMDSGIVSAKTFARSEKNNLGLTLDVILPGDTCTVIPAFEIPLSYDLPALAFGLNAARQDGERMTGGHPTIHANFKGGGMESRSGSWVAREIRQFNFGGVDHIVIPFNTNNSGLVKPAESLMRATSIEIEYDLYLKDSNARYNIKSEFSLKGSSAAIKRAKRICSNVQSGRSPDAGIATGVHGMGKTVRQKQSPACKGSIRSLYQYSCDALILADTTGIGKFDYSKIDLCQKLANDINQSCPTNTMRNLLTGGY